MTTITISRAPARLATPTDLEPDAIGALSDAINPLVAENKAFAARQRRAHEICDEHDDVATASLLENFIDETERRTWFLFETLQGADHTN